MEAFDQPRERQRGAQHQYPVAPTHIARRRPTDFDPMPEHADRTEWQRRSDATGWIDEGADAGVGRAHQPAPRLHRAQPSELEMLCGRFVAGEPTVVGEVDEQPRAQPDERVEGARVDGFGSAV